jgi:hypothetical protein
MIKKGFITLGELEKMFNIFSNSVDYEILTQDRTRFKESFKPYSKNQ